MKGNKSPDNVHKEYGTYLDDIIYMPIVHLDNAKAKEIITEFVSDFNPVDFELLYREDKNPLPKEIVEVIGEKSLIWYNTLRKTMVGGHDDNLALEPP